VRSPAETSRQEQWPVRGTPARQQASPAGGCRQEQHVALRGRRCGEPHGRCVVLIFTVRREQAACRGPGPSCAWPSVISVQTSDRTIPDSAAAHWDQPITPESRYFSLSVYTPYATPFTAGGVSSSLPGYRITPEHGSTNPPARPTCSRSRPAPAHGCQHGRGCARLRAARLNGAGGRSLPGWICIRP
jgi:hypothetical protein